MKYESHSLSELKILAKNLNLKGYSNLKKNDLIKFMKKQLGGKSSNIMHYIKSGNFDKFKKLIEENNNLNINKEDKHGHTPLTYACKYGDIDIIELLIDKGANIDFITTSKLTALGEAAEYGFVDVVQFLISEKANLDPFIRCVERNYLDRLKIFINAGVDVNYITENNKTALTIAGEKGYVDIAKELISAGANLHPLLIASYNGDVNSVNTFISANINTDYSDNDGFTSLMMASEKGHVAIVNALILTGADINKINEEGSTALTLASQHGNIEVVDALIAANAKVNYVNNKGNNSGTTSLLFAIEYGHTDVALSLINAKANLKYVNNKGYTALMWACQQGNIEIVKELISKGVNINYKSSNGITSLNIVKSMISKKNNNNKKLYEDILKLLENNTR